MPAVYQWMRQRTTSSSSTKLVVADDPAAAYFSDYLAGVRIVADRPTSPADYGKEFTWRVKVRSYGGVKTFIHQEWSYRYDGTTQVLRGRILGFISFWQEFPAGSLGSPLLLNCAYNFQDDPSLSEYYANTTIAEYEERTDGALTAGGIGTPAGKMGNGGFDLRTLAIRNLVVENPVTDLSQPANRISAKGDFHTLPSPSPSALFPDGWTPGGDITYSVSARDPGRASTYWSDSGTATVSAVDPTGKVGAFDLKTPGPPETWNGKDDGGTGSPLQGVHLMEATAEAPNPSIDNGVSYGFGRKSFITYLCSCAAGSNTFCTPSGCFDSFQTKKGPNSFGYGWSSDTSSKITEDGDDLFFQSGDSYLRWRHDGTEYVAFSPSNYSKIEKNLASTNARYKVIHRDQTSLEFNDSGLLVKAVDRNNNSLTYTYQSGTDHVATISDQNGHSRHYTYRSDGQPLTMRENDSVTGRLTQFLYYPDTDTNSPDRLYKVVDPENNEITYVYYPLGPILSITDSEGLVAALYEYDEFGRLASHEIYGQLRRTYTYNSLPNITRLVIEEIDLLGVEPNRRKIIDQDRYGNTVRLLEIVTETPEVFETRTTEMKYEDPNNPYLMTKRIDPNLNIEETSYTADGKIKTSKDKSGYVTTYTYAEEIDTPLNPKHRDLIREILRPSVTVAGNVVTYAPTIFEYDVNGNLERITDAKGQHTDMTYSADGLVESITDRRGNKTELVYQGLPFNGDSRNLLQIKVPKGDSMIDGFRNVFFSYDAYDNVTSVKDDLDNEVVTEYDLLDRIRKVTDARDFETEYQYVDSLLKDILLPPNNGSSNLSRRTSLLYDSTSRLNEVKRDVDSSATQETRVKYAHNSFGEVIALTRLKNGEESSFSFTFDQAGRQIKTKDFLARTNSTAYEPYCLGQSSTSARGIRRKTSFDSRCLLRAIGTGDPVPPIPPDPEDPESVEIPGDPLPLLSLRDLHTWDYDELGRLTKSSRSKCGYAQGVFGLTQFGQAVFGTAQCDQDERLYDELDRVVRFIRTPKNEDSYEYLFEYDPEGNVTSVTEADDKVTEYIYFRDNLLKQVIVKRPSQPDQVFTYSYDPAGRLDKIVYPASTEIEAVFRDEADLTATGIGTGFDPNGNLRFLRYQKTDGTLLRRFEWTYDSSNNRQSMLDVNPTKAVKWEYGYDWLDRMVSVKRAEATTVLLLPVADLQRSYVFDESDNRQFFDDHVNGITYYYLYESWDDSGTIRYSDQIKETRQALSAGERNLSNFSLYESFQHDPDGNMVQRTLSSSAEVTSYKWTDFDRLKTVTSNQNGTLQENQYNVDGLRERKLDRSGNSSVEYGLGISTSASQPGSGSSSPSISYVSGHMIMGAEVNGVFQFWLTDHLGTVRDIVDDAGTVIQSYEFQEHGLPMPGSGASSGTFSPKTYQGGLSVNDDRNDSGLYLMGHRHFAADLGRFISRDPIGFQGGLNLFNGAGTSPVTGVDPSGLLPEWIDSWWYSPPTEGPSTMPTTDNGFKESKFTLEKRQFNIDGAKGSGKYDSIARSPNPTGSANRTWDNVFNQCLDKSKLDRPAAASGGLRRSRLPRLPNFSANGVLVFLGVLSVTKIASADPCERDAVAVQEGIGLLEGLAMGGLLSLLPGGQYIGAGLGIGAIMANTPTNISPEGGPLRTSHRGPDTMPHLTDWRRNMH